MAEAWLSTELATDEEVACTLDVADSDRTEDILVGTNELEEGTVPHVTSKNRYGLFDAALKLPATDALYKRQLPAPNAKLTQAGRTLQRDKHDA